MKLEVYDNLTEKLTKDIESFLLQNSSILNPLFSTPLWAKRLKDNLNFKYEFIIVKERRDIIALHLIFEGYRGYVKINKLPIIIRDVAKLYAKTFYEHITWNNFIVFKDTISDLDKLETKRLIYNYLKQKNIKIQNSPIDKGDDTFFNKKDISSWGTYIIDIKDKSYEEVYRSFKRQARRPIEKTLSEGVTVKTLSANNVEPYVKWVEKNQKETGKSYKIDLDSMIEEFNVFNKNGYIYEIFVAYKKDIILGSLGVWGYGNYISEFGVYQSKYAKENKLYVQDVIKNSIVQYMFEKNIRYYDLAGFNPSDESDLKEKSIRQFKEKFNGKEFLYNTISSIYK